MSGLPAARDEVGEEHNTLTGYSSRLEEFLMSSLRAPALAHHRQVLTEFQIELHRRDVLWSALD